MPYDNIDRCSDILLQLRLKYEKNFFLDCIVYENRVKD